MINLNLMKKLKKSTWVTLALLIYVSVTAAYLLPRNTEVSDTEKYITLAGIETKGEVTATSS